MGVLAAGGGALYFSGALGGGSGTSGDTVIIEAPKPAEKDDTEKDNETP